MLTVTRVLLLLLVLVGGIWAWFAWREGRLTPPPTRVELPEKGVYRGPVHTPLGPERSRQLQERAQNMRF